MTTDFSALCAELTATLAERIDDKGDAGSYYVHAAHLLIRARAALADEPAVPEGKKPTRDELWELWLRLNNELPDRPAAVAEFWEHAQIDARARAVLAHWGNPVPPPADGEVAGLMADLQQQANHGFSEFISRNDLLRAAKLLESLSPPQPVPVSERLPEPEVCVPHPRTKRGNWCWGFERCEVSLARPARWRLMHMETVEMEASHWLPAHALPLPEVGED